MAHETSKSLRRRMRDPNFAQKYFVGRAIDIGSGADPLSRQLGYWPLLTSVVEFDKGDGDASLLLGVKDNSYDLAYSSHCLEHVDDYGVALYRWWRLLRTGGHMVVTVPDFEMYERSTFPSRFNADHKRPFTVRELAEFFVGVSWGDVIKIERITEHFDPSLPDTYDQTQGLAEAAIEFIVRKPE